ncbi:MAG: hypothetical protein NPINA01_32480 [Nitrospinaceae bacterium]|nr:MAG: hypothetical protein NPINA01_32480 [Nitrospinaceae bacterium]
MIIKIAMGFIVGILSSGSGLGGGFLVVPFLVYLGHEAKTSVGTSVLFVALVAVSSLWAHSRLGNVDLKTGLLLALGGILGAQLGPQILENISDQNFKRGFSVLLITTGIWLLVNTRS